MAIIQTDNLINKIQNLFWLEKIFNINRYEIDKIKGDDMENIKKILDQNINKL